MKVSVVLTTYNGTKFLLPLLDSLRCQSRKIDEVLICDDCSKDGTREMIVNYIEKYNLTDWEKCWNTENYGWMKNFRIGIQKASGDCIFPCDQDDIWALNKVEDMVSVMEANREILLLSSDYSPLYEYGGHKVDEFQTANDNQLEKVLFNERFALHERPGCVMAVRKQLVDMTKDIWLDWYPHDAFLWTTANVYNGCYLLHKPLIQYRRHDLNASTGSQHVRKAQVNSMKRTQNIVNWRLKQDKDLSEAENNILSEYLQFSRLRIEFLREKKIVNWVKLLLYSRYYRSIRQQLGDWYYILHNDERL